MPIYIDPAWEYYQPPEDLEWLAEEQVGVVDLHPRVEDKTSNLGFRFSSRPDFVPTLRLAREKPSLRRKRRELKPERRCKGCLRFWRPSDARTEYCSPECYREQKTPVRAKCARCGEEFTPDSSASRFCSRECANRSQAVTPDDPRVSEAVRLSASGLKASEVAARLGVGVATVGRWRRLAKASSLETDMLGGV